MLEYLKIIRPKNLTIVLLSQALIYFVFLLPIYQTNSVEPALKGWLCPLFLLDTILIAAAGYVVNDIFDYSIDQINKDGNTLISEQSLSIRRAWLYYFTLVIAGLLIAAFIAHQIDKIHLLSIYPLATLLLILYSYVLKGTFFLGNLIVAIFCAFVPGIIWFAESDVIGSLTSMDHLFITGTFIAYITFGILSTLSREIIKDMEDIKGDEKHNLKTIPIVLGFKRSKWIAIFFLILLCISYEVFWRPIVSFNWKVSILFIGLLGMPSLLLILKTIKIQSPKDCHTVSQSLKILMIFSLILFLVLPYLR